MRLPTIALALCVAATVHAETPKKNPAPPPPPPKKVEPLAGMKLGAAIQIESLTLIPVLADKPATPKQDILVLDEAMDSKKVHIREETSESVNALTFVNKSEQPVFILAGEVILGGKQDRIIGANTIIPANTTQSVPVFCVEHGRWTETTNEFASAKALAHGRLRGQASYAAQTDVWKEVAVKNSLRNTKNDTDTYRTVAKQQSDGTQTTWQKKIGEGLQKLAADDRKRMVGYVVALNGAVATVDMFTSPALFQKLEPKLLKSYVTEAVDITAAKDVKAPTEKMVQDFVADAEKAKEDTAYQTKAAQTKRWNGTKTGKSSVEYFFSGDDAVAAPVYQNYQSK